MEDSAVEKRKLVLQAAIAFGVTVVMTLPVWRNANTFGLAALSSICTMAWLMGTFGLGSAACGKLWSLVLFACLSGLAAPYIATLATTNAAEVLSQSWIIAGVLQCAAVVVVLAARLKELANCSRRPS
jgi:uncharacterized membrane protein